MLAYAGAPAEEPRCGVAGLGRLAVLVTPQDPRVGTNQGINALVSNGRLGLLERCRLGVELLVPYRRRAKFIDDCEIPAAIVTTANFDLHGFAVCAKVLT